MDIMQIVGFGIVVTVLLVVLRQERPEMAVQLSVIAGILIFLALVGRISAVLNILENLSLRVNLDSLYFHTVLKIIGIAYVAEFGAQICRDASEGAVASKIEFAGKIMIVILAVPIIGAILETVINLLP
ncbi:MAG: stage III sporulation protein AD [bacterium]|jgi:stage III sporulation protein AD